MTEEEKKTRREELDSIQKPAEYKSQYDQQIDAALTDYTSRKPFSYDVNSDALYQGYKDRYLREGKQAMRDTMGQAAAMTGGYGNSYAATAGNQAYQAYLGKLNDAVPELYNLALQKYQMEGQDLANRYNMFTNEDQRQYARWGDDYARWLQAYQQGVSEDQFREQMDESKRQFDAELAEKVREFDQTYGLKAYTTYGGGSYGGGGVYGSTTPSTGDFSDGWQGYEDTGSGGDDKGTGDVTPGGSSGYYQVEPTETYVSLWGRGARGRLSITDLNKFYQSGKITKEQYLNLVTAFMNK